VGDYFFARMALFFFWGDSHTDDSDTRAGGFHFDGIDAHYGRD
jgi:hypothetical protein